MHLIFTFHGTRFHPRDADLLARMQVVSPRISRDTTMWDASTGFHASHGLGVILFGLVYLYFAVAAEAMLIGSWFLIGVGVVYLAGMTVLARRYWFSIPFRGIALAAILYVAGVLSAAV
jgi:hypothetical protein